MEQLVDAPRALEIIYRVNPWLEAHEVAGLFKSAGLRRPVDDLNRIQRMLNNANLTIAAYHEDRLVGIARGLTDFSYCCYLSDLAVAKEYQGRGIGRELVRRMKDMLGDEVMLLLLSAPNAMSYYPYIGFEQADNAWIIHRTR
jgi:ribosomal protein S18 acetylase RimI-like enzyme